MQRDRPYILLVYVIYCHIFTSQMEQKAQHDYSCRYFQQLLVHLQQLDKEVEQQKKQEEEDQSLSLEAVGLSSGRQPHSHSLHTEDSLVGNTVVLLVVDKKEAVDNSW